MYSRQPKYLGQSSIYVGDIEYSKCETFLDIRDTPTYPQWQTVRKFLIFTISTKFLVLDRTYFARILVPKICEDLISSYVLFTCTNSLLGTHDMYVSSYDTIRNTTILTSYNAYMDKKLMKKHYVKINIGPLLLFEKHYDNKWEEIELHKYYKEVYTNGTD